MALVTVHRSPTPSNSTDTFSEVTDNACENEAGNITSPYKPHSLSETYLTVKGAALMLASSNCLRTLDNNECEQSEGSRDMHKHLYSMCGLLRPSDNIKLAVRLESMSQAEGHVRYMTIVSTAGCHDVEESMILGVDIIDATATIGLALPVWADLDIHLDGDGGFNIMSNDRQHVLKPVSVQAMWSALQSVIGVRDVARRNNYYVDGLTHTWVSYYMARISSSLAAISEWHQMEDIECHRPVELNVTETACLERLIRSKLKDIMMTVDLEEVTSKYLRNRLEEELNMSLTEFKHFIDEEMITIMRQMDAPSQIFDYLYLGSEWNASNLDELQKIGVGYILNVTREIDNFFPGIFEYCNVRLYDLEDSDLLKHWPRTFDFISKARCAQSKVLVHCKMGISRSASTVIAYAMKEQGWSLDTAYQHVKQKRSCIKPNAGFMQQLTTYQGILDASKQRHSGLWRSVSSGNLLPDCESLLLKRSLLCDASHTPALTAADLPMTVSSVKGISHSMCDENELSLREQMLSDGRLEDLFPSECSRQLPLIYRIDDWHLYDNNDSFDDDNDDANQTSITLISYIQHDWTDTFNLAAHMLADHVDCSVTDEVDDGPGTASEQGFYDVSMLSSGAALLSDCLSDADKERILLHPDLKMEYIMATHHRQRRVAEQLLASECPLQSAAAADDDDDKSSRLSREPSFVSSCPQPSKVKPDDFWIRDVADTLSSDCEEVKFDSQQCTCESASVCSCGSSVPVNSKSPPNSITNSLQSSPTSVSSQARKVVDIAHQLTQEENNIDKLTEPEAKAACPLSIYETEGISFEPGLVRRTVDLGVDISVSPAKTIVSHPASIYETEDISLEPGLVRRTRQEIEQRERSSSMVDIAAAPLSPPLSELNPVQRSSSLRVSRLRSPEKCESLRCKLERRKTCIPFIDSTLAADIDDRLQQAVMTDDNDDANDVEFSEDDTQSGVCVIRVGSDDVEIEEGKVKRTMRDFEVKYKEDVERPQSLSVGIPLQHRDQSVITDEIPVESGSVLRQKNEIEMKFGSSPRHSKLSPDHSLCPPSATPSDAARLTPTLEKYCASDMLTLTEEVPEGFLDEDGENMQELDWQKQLLNDSLELSRVLVQDTTEGSSQFQRSFSYRENCQQKQPKMLPFSSRSASFRLRSLSDAAKTKVASNSNVVSRTSVSSHASFSSAEVCSQLLKDKNQQNECISVNKLCDTSPERKHEECSVVTADRDKQSLLSNVLHTVQSHSQQLPAEVSAVTDVVGTNCKNNLNQVSSQSLKTDATKSIILPLVNHDQRTIPGSAFVSKIVSQQSSSHSSRTKLSAESASWTMHQSDKIMQPSSLAGSSNGSKPLARNTASEDISLPVTGDTVQESNFKVPNEEPVNNSQSQSAQVDATDVISDSAIHSVHPLLLGRHDEASSVTKFVADHSQSADTEQCHVSLMKKQFSFSDKSASFISYEPGKLWRSQSVRNKSSSFLQHTAGDSEPAEAHKVKKPYGKSHPLSKLSSEYLSRDCSTTIKDFACDHNTT